MRRRTGLGSAAFRTSSITIAQSLCDGDLVPSAFEVQEKGPTDHAAAGAQASATRRMHCEPWTRGAKTGAHRICDVMGLASGVNSEKGCFGRVGHNGVAVVGPLGAALSGAALLCKISEPVGCSSCGGSSGGWPRLERTGAKTGEVGTVDVVRSLLDARADHATRGGREECTAPTRVRRRMLTRSLIPTGVRIRELHTRRPPLRPQDT